MRTSNLARIGALAIAAFAPLSASAGGVWTDGNFYAACPASANNTSMTVDAAAGWESGFFPYARFTSVPFVSAYVYAEKNMACVYDNGSLRFELVQVAPAPYTRCTMYNSPWFICTL